MGSQYLSNPIIFLIEIASSLYLLAIMLRFLFQIVRADFYNPLSQFIVKITQPAIKPLRRLVPSSGSIDASSVLLMLVIQMVTLALIGMLQTGNGDFGFLYLLFAALAELVSLAINVFLVALLAQVVLSWVNPGAYNPTIGLLFSLNEPLLSRVRKVVPAAGGFDFSSLIVLIGLQLLKMLLIPPLHGLALAF